MARTQLFPRGWSGASEGKWNRQANIVIDDSQGIETNGSELIDALEGDDLIRGKRRRGAGLLISRDPKRANLQLGRGRDAVTGISNQGDGIENHGYIYTGAGDDEIIGSGTDNAIRNQGFIYTQGGDDVVNVINGGIRGKNRFVSLGAGKDTFIGFSNGRHTVYGDAGKDLLLLGEGKYDINRRSSRSTRIKQLDNNDNNRLDLIRFEQIGSVDGNRQDIFKINDEGSGVITIDRSGKITFED